ncbi:VWA domain-containing protein [Fodinicurvata sp. EGI_FJ10296]|uniref:VWA domain-containing protein n=1 Tax=Fodinicurvata sp. EGI_FJ10296 TaxID=3231908 RepID=UPI0034558575
MKLKNSATTLGAGFAAALLATFAQAEDVTVVWDTSNSMWGQIDGESKIEIARRVMADTVGEWVASGADVGLVAYGHRRSEDCSDIETVLPVGPLDPDTFLQAVNGLTPRGMTPLSDAVRHAAGEMSSGERPATVVLISDGIESCDADPCAVAAELAEMGVDFRVHVVGFDVADVADPTQLQCIAENTGGRFFTADSASELSSALVQAAQEVQAQPEPEPEPAPEPEPEPEPEPIDVGLSAPESVVMGSVFNVSWENSAEPRDYVTIVPSGADEGTYEEYSHVQDEFSADLTAPADPGLYEVWYVVSDGRRTVASVPVEVVTQDVSVSGPGTVATGAPFEVTWENAINGRDFVTIVSTEAAEGEYGDYSNVSDSTSATLTAPAEAGLFEIRYVLSEGRRTLATAPIKVAEQDVTVDAPETAVTGSDFSVEWDGAINERDFVTIVPLDAEEGEYTDYVRVGDDSQGSLRAPAEPGFYEIRYVLDEGRRTLASAPIEIVTQEVSVSGPETAVAGSSFGVAWEGSIHPRDFVTIVPLDAAEGEYGDYVRVGDDDTDGDLRAPAEPGFYEIRYVLDEGRQTLASAPIEIVTQEVSVSGPETAVAGSSFGVAWEGSIHPRDFVTIVPLDAAEGEYGDYVRVGDDDTEGDLRAPAEPGFYEIRYVLDEGRQTLASAPIEIVTQEVSVSAPETAVTGSDFRVEWTGTIHPRDFVTIVPLDAEEGEYDDYVRTGDDSQGSLRAPAEPGFYEIRYVLDEGRRTLASAPIEIVTQDVSVSAPETAVTGSDFRVEWSDAIHPRDFVTIVPLDAEQGEYTDYVRVGDDSQGSLTAPGEPGFYEIRYVLEEGRRTLASAPIELIAVTADITPPEDVVAEAPFTVSWQGPGRRNDRILLVATGGNTDSPIAEHEISGGGGDVRFDPLAETGPYDLVYVLGSDGSVIARASFEVGRVEATLDAPATAAAGGSVEVEWTGPGNDRDRIAIAEPGMPTMQWLDAVGTADGKTVTLPLPDAAGTYELRYFDFGNRAILVRREISVE